jgi:coenzyme F420 hydrogenase subunit beta
MAETTLAGQAAAVVRDGLCSGCGACVQLGTGLGMALVDGFSRPLPIAGAPASAASPHFDRVCPGRTVVGPRPAGSRSHPTMGPVVTAVQGWATDAELRHRGSSGGVLSALTAWLVESGRARSVVGAAADPATPTRTVTVQITSRQEALAAAGSRYGPVSNAAAALVGQADTVFIGKPCEVDGVRALAEVQAKAAPLLLSFFCAGTPNQAATDALVAELAGQARPTAMWYRGRGWPGRFTVVTAEGGEVGLGYDESWGRVLGRATQWRCKLCPDGVGDSADLVAADFWQTDERGYPSFAEGDGVSAILARTRRGAEVLAEAVAAGVLETQALDVDALAAVQPFQVTRRSTLWGRLLGTRLAGRPVPRYRGFALWRHALRAPLAQVRTARGSFSRARAGGGRG